MATVKILSFKYLHYIHSHLEQIHTQIKYIHSKIKLSPPPPLVMEYSSLPVVCQKLAYIIKHFNHEEAF